MNIIEFSEIFSKSQEQEDLVKKHIIKTYLPYEKKIVLCENIIKGADYTSSIDIIDKRYYSPNTPIRFVFFCMSILDNYTDIECEQFDDGNKNIIGGFNTLDQYGFFEVLFKELGREYNVLNTVLQMMVDDTYNKENSLVSFLTTKLDSIEALYNAALPIIEDKIVNFPGKED